MTAIALSIAGSDPSGGAGIQADLKTFAALKVYGAAAITLLTVQNTHGVRAVQTVDPAFVRAQIEAVLDDLAVGAIKIGALGSAAVIEAVAEALTGRPIDIVLDPVMVAKSGDPLLDEEAVAALTARLLPMAAILTPNIPEAAKLTGSPPATTQGEMLAQGEALRALGIPYVLMKGGHGTGPHSTDILLSEGRLPTAFKTARVATKNTHGTGCTLSAAIAAHLAHKFEPMDALQLGKLYVTGCIEAADQLSVGTGVGPVHHFHRQWVSAQAESED